MLITILLLIALAFVAYALITQYQRTPTDKSVPKRVLAALIAAAGAIGAAVSAWFHSGAPTGG
jgi:glycyl-tRNA synthetase beta subunit